MKVLMPSPVDRVECAAPQRGDGYRERRPAALEGARRADPELGPHPYATIEGARMQQQPLQDVLVAADMRAAASRSAS